MRLKLTRKGKEIASMFVQQGRKGFRGKMRIISNGAGAGHHAPLGAAEVTRLE